MDFAGEPPGRGGGGKLPPNPKNCCGKWCYFPEVYKMKKILEDGIEIG